MTYMKNTAKCLLSLATLFTFLLTSVSTVQAFRYSLTCESGRLTAFESFSNNSDDECNQFKKLGFEKCFDTKKKDLTSESIAISVPFDGYYTSRQHATYSRAKMEQIIDFAVKNEIDPYLALAFRILEYPPTQEKAKFDAYEKMWGVIPLDGPAFADFLGCRATGIVEIPGRSGKYTAFSESKLKNTLVIDPAAKEERICLENIGMGGSPHLSSGCTPDLKCCINAKIKLVKQYNTCQGIDAGDRALLLEKSSAAYLKQRINSALKRYQTLLNDPVSIISFSTQSFNGYGKYGTTEKMGNNCLDRMNFAITPLYGTGVGDLMLNSLMANSGVREMVNASLKKQSLKSAKSLFCDALGNSGKFSLNAGGFVRLQAQFMAERKNCPLKSYELRTK